VLYLRLDDLQVKLLGLNLDTSTVTVRIHGESSRVLGSLFCQLAKPSASSAPPAPRT